MALIEIDRNPSAKMLRWFGVLMVGFFVLTGGLAQWRWPAAAAAIWIFGVALTGVYAAVPPLRRHIYLGWVYAALPIGWTVSHLILATVFYLVVTPIGLGVRVVKGDPLERAPERSAASYWSARSGADSNARRYFKQF